MACILIVDDDQFVIRTLRAVLEYAGHVVFGARDGEECEQILSFSQPDLIIMDIFMPKRDGLAAIEITRQRRANQRILAISGGHRMNADDPLTLAHRAGADATLRKPFDNDRLLAAVTDLLS